MKPLDRLLDRPPIHRLLADLESDAMTSTPDSAEVRVAERGDADAIGRLLHDFNVEFGEPTPGSDVMASRVRRLLEAGEITVLLAGREPDGLALLRFRPSLWSDSLDAYLEELYVAPARRGQGRGRALMEAAIDLARSRGGGDMH